MSTYLPKNGNLSMVYSAEYDLYTNNKSELAKVAKHPHVPKREINYNITDDKLIESMCKEILLDRLVSLKVIIETLLSRGSQSHSDVTLTDADKVKIMYFWLSLQIARTTPVSISADRYSFAYQINQIRHSRNTCAVLFALMCFYAKIPCVIIKGFVKGGSYYPQEKMKEKYTREWNAVLVDGHWRLVDVLWGSGETVDTRYLFPDPEKLRLTHFTDRVKWQLVVEPTTQLAFEAQAFIKPRFFELNMKMMSDKHGVIICQEGELELCFQLDSSQASKQEFKLLAKYYNEEKMWELEKLDNNNLQIDFIHKRLVADHNLHDMDSKTDLDGESQISSASILSITVRFPRAGLYKIEICGRSNDVFTEFDWIAIYNVQVKMVHDWLVFFPRVDKIGWGPNSYLEECGLKALSHIGGEIICIAGKILEVKFGLLPNARTRNVSLRFKLQDVVNQYDEHPEEDNSNATYGGNSSFSPSKDGDIVIQIPIKQVSEMILNIYATLNATDKGHVINYRVLAKLDPKQKMEEFRAEIIGRLNECVKGLDIKLLTQALSEARASGLHRDRKVVDIFRKACARHRYLSRYLKCLKAIEQISNTDIASLRSMNRPDDRLVCVLRATLVLLGEDPSRIVTWEDIQPHLTILGPKNLNRRLKNFEITDADIHSRIQKVESLLGDKHIDLVEILGVSREAAAFAHWIDDVFQLYKLKLLDC
ncbi:lim and transglutaminase domain protein ltd-1-like isoform X2 [Dreissena polymorpha]|nr:lim and transglutaminase domain protein ltd-1-like isoform X2 [Dreissena polymorpha]